MKLIKLGEKWLNLDQMTDARIDEQGNMFVYFGGHADLDGNTEWLTVKIDKASEVEDLLAVLDDEVKKGPSVVTR